MDNPHVRPLRIEVALPATLDRLAFAAMLRNADRFPVLLVDHEPEVRLGVACRGEGAPVVVLGGPVCSCCLHYPREGDLAGLFDTLQTAAGRARFLPATLSPEAAAPGADTPEADTPEADPTEADLIAGMPDATERDPLATLTRRELEVLRLVGEGYSVPQCAERLGVARSTIGNHKYRLMRKLGVQTSLQLLRIAVRAGLVAID